MLRPRPTDRFIIIWEQRAAGMPSSAPFGSEAVKVSESDLHVKDQSAVKS